MFCETKTEILPDISISIKEKWLKYYFILILSTLLLVYWHEANVGSKYFCYFKRKVVYKVSRGCIKYFHIYISINILLLIISVLTCFQCNISLTHIYIFIFMSNCILYPFAFIKKLKSVKLDIFYHSSRFTPFFTIAISKFTHFVLKNLLLHNIGHKTI